MATITEDYVSFEVAKLLKEKGFDVPCLACWYIGSEEHEKFGDSPFNYNEVKNGFDWLSRPTLQMAMKWLREVHNLFIEMHIQNNGNYIGYIYNTNGFGLIGWDKRRVSSFYEKACEAAIKYSLENLI